MFDQDFWGMAVLGPQMCLSQDTGQVREPCPSHQGAQVRNLRTAQFTMISLVVSLPFLSDSATNAHYKGEQYKMKLQLFLTLPFFYGGLSFLAVLAHSVSLVQV